MRVTGPLQFIRPTALVALAAAAGLALPAAAQQPNRVARTLLLPPEHWTYDVAHRLDAARLTDRGFDPAAGTLTLGEIAGVLSAAAGRAEAADHPLQLQVLDWLERLRAEYPGAFTEGTPSLSARAELAVGVTTHQNPVGPRAAEGSPQLLADTLSAFATLRAGASIGGRVQLEFDVAASQDGVALREAYGAGRIGRLGLWAGRRRPGFLSTAGGGMVVDRAAVWDGGGLWLTSPLRLPLLGRLRFETFLAVADSNGKVAEPWFWATRGTVEPLPRFTIGVTRAIMFGDTAGGRAVDWGEFGMILIGLNSAHERDDAYPDNQIVAVDGRWRMPSDPVPLELYLTWGAEDSAGAWWKSPAIIAGIFAPALPGAPALALGVEHAVFTGASGHGHFYAHSSFTDGWEEGGRLIGHPLGGTGREWLLYGSFDRGEAGPAIHWRGFRRVRPEGNLLSPDRGGESWGGGLDLTYDLLPFLRLHGRVALEAGSGWKTGSAVGQLEWRPASSTPR